MPIPMSNWVKNLPEEYFVEMKKMLTENRFNWPGSEEFLRTQHGAAELERQIYGRMQQCRHDLIPWIRAALPLSDKAVLEIGAGTGASTVPIAMASRELLGIDINDGYLACGRKRCDLLGVRNAALVTAAPDWLQTQENFEATVGGFQFNIVICYALFEHLLINERIVFLKSLWDRMPVGSCLVIFETPNRLHWFDWHSSKLPFLDWLPDELASVYYSRSKRPSVPDKVMSRTVEEFGTENREKMYRFGRGASYHEFELAIGLNRMEVVAHSGSPKAVDRLPYMPEAPGYSEALRGVLREMGVDSGFGYPSLDLILRKIS